jgi:hypothetical protein
MDANIAAARRALRKLEGDLLRTTALAVLHNRAASLARRRLLAASTIRH